MKLEIKILIGDVREKIREIPDNSIHCCVTSPPYWGLRKYGDSSNEIGLEKDFRDYIETIRNVFREVRRILRPDGTLWLNLGDSYATGAGKANMAGGGKQGEGWKGLPTQPNRMPLPGLKPKDLIGIPWRLAFALQRDGWYLRSDIIWAKPNCMPESVTDRPTRSHEYVFLLTKGRHYFYDAEAIREPATESTLKRTSQNVEAQTGSSRANGGAKTNGPMKAVLRGDKQRGHSRRHSGFNDRWDQMERHEQTSGWRNKRDVWTISPANFDGAHFAVMPPAIAKPCILAGTSGGGCCASCGKPRERIIEKGDPDLAHQRPCGGDSKGEYHGEATKDFFSSKAQNASEVKARILRGMTESKTVGWKKTCSCETDLIIPCTVFDPFLGSGTTGEVALNLGRNITGIELYETFKPMIEKRTVQNGLALV